MSDTDFRGAAQALAIIRADGITVRAHFSGRVTLSPDTKVLPRHRDLIRDHEGALNALLTLQTATVQAVRRQANQ